MSDTSPFRAAPAPRNRLLAALPLDVMDRLARLLEPVQTTTRQILCKMDDPIQAAYFPETGWVSMLAFLRDGKAAEVGIVGLEGMIGLPLVLGGDRMGVECLVQAPGTLLRIGSQSLLDEMERNAALRSLLLRYALAFQRQITQTVACNGHHSLTGRLARWLLMALDRADGNEFPMTHEFLALMLCANRPGVTVAANSLQKAGIIRYAKGRITVLDRGKLEAASCECHAVIAHDYEVALGLSSP